MVGAKPLAICPLNPAERGTPMTATTESAATLRGDLRTPRGPAPGPRPDVNPEPSSTAERVLVAVFVAVPFLALIAALPLAWGRSEEHTSELQSRPHLVC